VSAAARDPYPTIAALGAGYRDGGGPGPVEVTRAHLDRIAALDPAIGAFQEVFAQGALAQAEAAERMLASGQDPGPFHGIPYVLKDICDVEGRITTGGCKVPGRPPAPRTGTIAARLMAAGGVLLGKTRTVESALGGWGTNLHMGTPRNPWDRTAHRIPGGSSSGTGAGVASGMAVCGLGTDTGGSVRLPAAFCGLVGLKVTEGRLPNDGILPLSQTLDTPGPMARSVADAALMFAVMEGRPGPEIAAACAAPGGIFPAPVRGVRGLRLGVLDSAERGQCSAEVLAGYDAALDLLADLGAELDVFDPGRPLAELTRDCGRLIATEGWAHHGHLYAREDLPLDPHVRARMQTGRGVSAADYIAMLSARRAARDAFLARMGGFDALLTPTTTVTAPLLDQVDEDMAPGHFTRFVNYFGLCALAVPCGVSCAGLPVSIQIVARPGAEAQAIGIGRVYERARPAFAYPELD